VHQSTLAQNPNVTARHSWTGTAAQNLLSLFKIFGPTKLISSSKSAGVSPVNVLCFPLNCCHFRSATQPVPLYTDLFLYNSVCHHLLSSLSSSAQQVTYKYEDRVATCKDEIFPQGAAKAGGSQQVARSPERAPSFLNLNLGTSRTPHNYVTLLSCVRMLKFVSGLTF